MNTHDTLSEQLREIAPRIRGNRPFLRKVFELTAAIRGDDAEQSVREARMAALHWIQNRSGRLPEVAWEFQGFDLDQPVAPATVVAMKTGHDIWAARLDDSDRSVPGRSWTTEIMVALSGSGEALFGTRLMVSTRGEDLPYESSTPGVVRQLIDSPGLLDGHRPLTQVPWEIESTADTSELAGFIEAPFRQLPLFVVTLRAEDQDNSCAVLDVDRLARRCAGLAHVVLLPDEHTYVLTDHLGREFSVFGGAVRTYWPQFDRFEDSPFRHQLAVRDRVEHWGNRGALDFENLLVSSAYRRAINKSDSESHFPRFSTVRSFVTKARRRAAAAGRDLAEQLELAQMEIEELTKDREEWKDSWEAAELDRSEAEVELDLQRQEQHRLRARIAMLEQRVETLTEQKIDSEIELPDSLDALQEWVDLNLAGRLVITGRASRAAKNAEFRDVSLVYKTLLLLANQYRGMKVSGGKEQREAFDEGCHELGLECTPTFHGAAAGEQGDEYFVDWNRAKHPLDMHLKNGGNTRDPSRCLRVYFFWDDLSQQVVVGSLPAHLRTRLT